MDGARKSDPLPEPVTNLVEAALRLQQEGRFEAAESLFRAALAADPGHFAALCLFGKLQTLRGDHETAAALLTRALEHHPGSALAHSDLAQVLWRLHRPEEALAHLVRAIFIKPDFKEALLNRSAVLLDLGRTDEALASCDRALALKPDWADALLVRGGALIKLGRPVEALAAYDRALALEVRAETLVNRANALLRLGRPLDALASADQALVLDPEHPEALLNRGVALLTLKRPLEALESSDRALALRPDYADALLNRGTALLDLDRPTEALDSVDRVLAIQPDHILAPMNKGITLCALERHQEALGCFDRTLAVQPDNIDALMNKGTALHTLGRHQEALDCWDRALAFRPDHAATHSNRIFVMDFLPGLSFQEHQGERARYWQIQSRGVGGAARPHANDRDPARPLVLGYVSADFRQHSAALCFGPVLRRHDRARFQIVCYSGVRIEDDVTLQFRRLADAWRPVAGLTDDALAEQIRADGIDILIDLSGHSKGNRLLAFARQPAPVQVTAWGHCGGTGLPAIGYQFTDPVAIPPWARPLFAEACWDLPCFLPFEPPGEAPVVLGLPAKANGFVTFGSLQRFSKVSPAALDQWTGILAALPGSRLLVKDAVLGDPAVRDRFLDHLAGRGIGPERIELRGATTRQGHLATYNEIDLVLDTFPQNGGISTWEALWMGVPVVALLGNSPASRISGAILHALGLGGWVAQGETEYLDLALRGAADLDGLARFRAGARAMITAQPAGDPERYTRAVEAAYRTMWRRWTGDLPDQER